MRPTALKTTVILCLLSAGAALAATEVRLNYRFAVQPGGTLVVDVGFGSIEVTTNGTSEVVVDVWRKIGRRNKTDEEAFLRDNPVEFAQEGNTAAIQSHGRSNSSWLWSGRNQNDAKYTISVPSQFNAQLKTGGGGVSVVDLTGNVKVHTDGGGLSFARLHGPLNGETGGGGVNASDCEGTLHLRTGGGGIEVAGGSGSLDGTTGGGGIGVKRFQGAAHVSTGGGGITAVLPSELADTVKLSTGGGGISVSAPETVAFNLDAKTDGDGVSSDLPVTVAGKIEHGRLEGPVNGGGKTVQLRSGGGNIQLKKL